jgi:nitronate monooxygenase
MIQTTLTKQLGIRHPVILAPMGGVSGGRLAAAVSNAGGLGLVGGGYGDAAWLDTELAIAAKAATQPWGVGLITWTANQQRVEQCLRYGPAAFMLSFGDPRPYARAIKAAGCALICQVQDLAGALLARDAGADIIVAQGTEAGGHGGLRSTFPLVPAVVDAVAPIPVAAAGGIADGRGLAAALMLGAQAALIGTRFYACSEALGSDEAKRRIAAGHGDETVRTRVFDIVRGYDWPAPYTGRALRNDFLQRWHEHEPELQTQAAALRDPFFSAAALGDCDTAMVWAGEAIDLIHDIPSAASLLASLVAQAESQIRQAHAALAL